MNVHMRHEHNVGSKEWEEYVIGFLNNLKEASMKEGKDMRANNLDILTDELAIYFKLN